MKILGSDFKEYLLGAYYPSTDEIKYCTSGSCVWQHENRHREQFKSKTLIRFTQMIPGLMWVAIGALAGGQNIVAALIVLLWATVGICLEVDAWWNGIIRYLTRKKICLS